MPDLTYNETVKIIAHKKLVEAWRKTIFLKRPLIDPNFVYCWYSMALGYALGQGCDIITANEVVNQIEKEKLI